MRTYTYVCVCVPIDKEIWEELGEKASWRKGTDFILRKIKASQT